MLNHYTRPDPVESSANGENATDLVAVSADYDPRLTRQPHRQFDSKAWSDFARAIWRPFSFGARWVLEVRIPNACIDHNGFVVPFVRPDKPYKLNVGGYFDSLVPLGPWLGNKLRNVSAYITCNAVSRSQRFDREDMGLYRNKLAVLRKGAATSDGHIIARRAVFLDLDCEKAEGFTHCSATDGERAAPLDMLRAIFAAYPEIERASVYGTSGNGFWVLVWIDPLPNTTESTSLVAEFVAYLARRFNRPGAHLDLSTHNASRIVPIGGRIKCKGPNAPDRPWRLARMLSAPDRPIEELDLADWMDHHWDRKIEHPKLQSRAVAAAAATPAYRPFDRELTTRRDRFTQIRIRSMLDSVKPAISGQHGHDRTYNAASLLVWDFALEIPDALGYLRMWNVGCQPPWNEHELIHKCEDARNAAHDKPRGSLLIEGEEWSARKEAEYLASLEVDLPDESVDLSVSFDDADAGEGVAL